MGALTVTASLCLTVTPAQADSPFGGGGADVKPGTMDPRSLDDPERRNELLARCGESCTVMPGEWLGPAREGTPTRLGEIRQNCGPNTSTLAYKDEHTETQTTIVGISIDKNPASLLPKIEKQWIQSQTTGTTDTIEMQAHQVGWIDEVPVTRLAKATWKLEGSSGLNVNEVNQFGPREFHDVEADITYKIIRHHVRDMTPEEVAQCGNTTPS
ncbi:hypothetical protein [Streptomyces sp. NPDC048637]|uniref:hypothetical protein n=1 Tax=Streptomyces sp. NPDC048637 TaxID=3155636 RepID=UPI00341B6928